MSKKCKCHEKKAQYHHTRRQFLSMLGLGATCYVSADPLSILFRSMADGLIAKAQAQEANIPPRNYVVAVHYGAPPRWVFDNFLRPQGSNSPFVKNAGMNNYLNNDNFAPNDNYNLDYRDALIDLGGGQSINLPIMWGATIPTIAGPMVPMSSILNNTMLVRGIDMEVDIGHGSGPALVTRVSDAAPSLSGLVADRSNRPIPAVGLTPASVLGGYKSAKGTSLAYLEPDYTNTVGAAMERLTDPVTINDPNVINSTLNRDKMATLSKQAQAKLGNYAASNRYGAQALYNDRYNAQKLFDRDLTPIVAQYYEAIGRYQTLARGCMQYIPNIIPNNLASGWQPGKDGNNGAEGFAAAEVLLKNGLSSTINFGMGGAAWGVYGYQNYNDEHRQTDRSTPILVHSHQFRCVAAWLYEFRRALGPELFNETLVHVSAEYGRNPQQSLYGSDHAPGATSMTFFSGAIKKPTFIGNIYVGSSNMAETYPGTWGFAAPLTSQGGTFSVTKKNIGAGVADILRVARPTSDKPIFTLSNEEVVSLALEEPKNI